MILAFPFLLLVTFIAGYMANILEVWNLKDKIKNLKKKYEVEE